MTPGLPSTTQPTSGPLDLLAIQKFYDDKMERAKAEIASALERELAMYKRILAVTLSIAGILAALAGYVGYQTILTDVEKLAKDRMSQSLAEIEHQAEDKAMVRFSYELNDKIHSSVEKQLRLENLKELVIEMTAKQTTDEVRDRLVKLVSQNVIAGLDIRYVRQGIAYAALESIDPADLKVRRSNGPGRSGSHSALLPVAAMGAEWILIWTPTPKQR